MKIFNTNFVVKWHETGIKEPFSIDWATLFDVYKKNVKKNYKVLEIGASYKARTKQLAQECESLTGLEILPERMPKDFDNIHFVLGNWEKLSQVFPEDSFDMAAASHVLEHVNYDQAAISELYKVLKKGGMAVLSTPNRDRLAARIGDFFNGKRKWPWGEHFREHTEETLHKLIGGTPFKDYQIIPVAFGISGWKLFMYMHPVPPALKKLCGFWVIVLKK